MNDKNPLINTEGRGTSGVVAWVEAHIQIQIQIKIQTQLQTQIRMNDNEKSFNKYRRAVHW